MLLLQLFATRLQHHSVYLTPFAPGSQVVRLQRMFIRIINADFAPVPWLSPECRDLVARLLNPDPKARMTVTDALRHPWVRLI